MDRVALSRALFRRGEKETAKPAGTTRIYQGTATSDSDGGLLTIAIDGPAFTENGTQSIDAVCTPAVKAGQTVQVAVIDGSPVVLGATGWGDEVDGTVQHFWHDSSGAHVSTEDGVSEGSRNSLWTSAGIFFRRQAARLLALLAGDSWTGLKVYDGLGNASANEVASFGVDTSGTDPEAEAVIGYVADRHLHVDSDSIDVMNGSVIGSQFTDDTVSLGKNSAGAKIKFCGDNAQLGYYTSSDQVYIAAAGGAYFTIDENSDIALGISQVAANDTRVILNGSSFRFGDTVLTWRQMAHAVGRWVVSRGGGGSNDWSWQIYSDGTFDAWCCQSGKLTYQLNDNFHGMYYYNQDGSQGKPYWQITGLNVSAITYLDMQAVFDHAVWAMPHTLNSNSFGFYLMSPEQGTHYGRILCHVRGVIGS